MDTQPFFLSSMESHRFSGVFACTPVRVIERLGRWRGLEVSCEPAVPAQDLGMPEGLDRLVLICRFDGDGIWPIERFPVFVHICIPGEQEGRDEIRAIAWGELYASEQDAASRSMTPTRP